MIKLKANQSLQLLMMGAALSLCACKTSTTARYELAQSLGSTAQLQMQHYDAAPFKITAYQRITDTTQPINVYVEGDGLAWISRRQLSTDPTPTDPIALRLAGLDDSPNVIYLARPCQYTKTTSGTTCSSIYWSSHRFSEEVIESYDTILDQLTKSYNVSGYHLTGFSGGGGVVALLAAQREDVLSLRTVAGNLDHHAINSWHNVSLMPKSLNPVHYTAQLQHVPQIHYSGGKDKIVPPWLAQNFVSAIPKPNCAKTITAHSLGHENGWDTYWQSAHRQIPSC